MSISDSASRDVLLGLRIRTSPVGASSAARMTEALIEQFLIDLPAGKKITRTALIGEAGSRRELLVPPGLLKEAIRSLYGQGRIEIDADDIVQLSKTAIDDLSSLKGESERSLGRVVEGLFKEIPGDSGRLRAPFLLVLCKVVNKLGKEYAHELRFGSPPEQPIDWLALREQVSAVDGLSASDRDLLLDVIVRFMRSTEPIHAMLKWHLTQTAYFREALGIDETSADLIAGAFKDSEIYFDTNAIVPCFWSSTDTKSALVSICRKLVELGSKLIITKPTADELENSVDYNAAALRAAAGRIPARSAGKIRNFIYQAYMLRKMQDPLLSVDSFLLEMEMPSKQVCDLLGIEVLDDYWFDDARSSERTHLIADRLKHESTVTRGWPKSDPVADHDALLLQWLEERGKAIGTGTYLITQDKAFQSVCTSCSVNPGPMLTLEAFLQLAAPLAATSEDIEKVSLLFAAVLEARFAAPRSFFELSDFAFFAQVGIETQQLPAEDVEECIRVVKRSIPHADLSSPADRERVAAIMQGFFADPGSSINRRITELQDSRDDLARSNAQLESEMRQIQTDAAQKTDEIQMLKSENSEMKAESSVLKAFASDQLDDAEAGIRSRARTHKTLTICLAILAAALASYLSFKYGAGKNFWQKILNGYNLLYLLPVGIWRCGYNSINKRVRTKLEAIGERKNALRLERS